MDSHRIAAIYEEYIIAHDLERHSLLKELRSRCGGGPTVLYPGAFVHLTPSFYFQHVVYVDWGDFAREFYGQNEAVLKIINAGKQYRQKPFIRFIQQDFTHNLPVPEESFDLLLALYAGGISNACARYVKPGGLILSNDHHEDALEAAGRPDLSLCGVFEEQRGKVRFTDSGNLCRFLVPHAERIFGHRHTPRAAYYLFRKHPRSARESGRIL